MPRLQNLWFTVTSYLRAYLQYGVRLELSYQRIPHNRLRHGTLLALTLLSGALFYLVFRTDALHILQNVTPYISNAQQLTPAVLLPKLPEPVYQSFPSLISGISIVLFIALNNPASKVVWRVALAGSLGTLFLFEVLLGYFHWLDLFATLAGTLLSLYFISRASPKSTKCSGESGHSANTTTRLSCGNARILPQALRPTSAVVVFSSLLAIGSTWTNDFRTSECARYSEEGYCEEYKQDAQPVYMSYTKLRNSVAMEQARPLDRIGRLYLYNNYVFLNEVNEGIHILDNTDPASPVNIAFIRIPGNTEIAIRDNYLYADSYIDLITLDIGDLQKITVIGREESIFPYDEYQNIPQNVSLSNADVKSDLGVVVSYRLIGS